MTDKLKEDIAQILRDNITFSGQTGDYIIHGAIDKLIEYFTNCQSGQGWVSVEDGLPDDQQEVDLWLVPADKTMKPYRMKWTWEGSDSNKIRISGHRVTHWRLVPQPPSNP
jgi:hypothetical protein